ncbi:hypothetical protein PAHAL_3G292000 [Panicum hallii]|jgi:hypothetical protein|uniref:Disease resistance N-terminal domain-containing protein n=1 Tax=Panicum hallii TaxID=206008 RepID=A0A2T8KJV8_9POAL|nr:hypothetical protein PAHAL_3G292000 [Panicum hallii]
MAGSAVSAAASSLGRVASQEVSFLCGVDDEVEFLKEELRSLQTFLSTAAEARRGSGGDSAAEDSVCRIRDVAYEAENIIEAADYRTKRNSKCKRLIGAMTRYARKPSYLVALHRLGKDTLRVRRIQEIKSSREILNLTPSMLLGA